MRRWMAVSAVLVAAAPGLAADWPQWRGPARDGVAPDVAPPSAWPAALDPIWKVEVGEGHAGPVIAGGRVYAFSRRGEEEVLACLSAGDGKVEWRIAYEAPYTPSPDAREHGKGPKATPAIDGGKVYAFGISGILTCVDIDRGSGGAVAWQKRFGDRFKTTSPLYGAANSPLIEGDLCIVGAGGHDDGALAAFHKKTGDLVWEVKGDGPSYSSPIARDLAGERQVIALLQTKLAGLRARDGKLLWEWPFTTEYSMNIITPVVAKDLVIISGYGKGTTALRIAKGEKGFACERAWYAAQPVMFMSSPVIVEDHLYGLSQSGKGTLVCVALAGGVRAWSSPGGIGSYASIVRAGRQFLVLGTDGVLLVVAADPSAYKEIAKVKLVEGPVWAHLAVAGNRMYVKDKTHLACFAIPAEGGK